MFFVSYSALTKTLCVCSALVVCNINANAANLSWPKVNSVLKSDPAIEQQLDALLASMTIEQKVAQLIQPEIGYLSVAQMRKYGFGSYLNGGNTAPYGQKQSDAKTWLKYADEMYAAAIDSSEDGSSIPTIWGTDAMHGHSNVYGATLFPHNIGLGAARDAFRFLRHCPAPGHRTGYRGKPIPKNRERETGRAQYAR